MWPLSAETDLCSFSSFIGSLRLHRGQVTRNIKMTATEFRYETGAQNRPLLHLCTCGPVFARRGCRELRACLRSSKMAHAAKSNRAMDMLTNALSYVRRCGPCKKKGTAVPGAEDENEPGCQCRLTPSATKLMTFGLICSADSEFLFTRAQQQRRTRANTMRLRLPSLCHAAHGCRTFLSVCAIGQCSRASRTRRLVASFRRSWEFSEYSSSSTSGAATMPTRQARSSSRNSRKGCDSCGAHASPPLVPRDAAKRPPATCAGRPWRNQGRHLGGYRR